jgi:mannose-6-phosphate isomerase-like protein (cupin superfamily)
MQNRNKGSPAIAGRQVIAQGADLTVSILTLTVGQCVRWRSYSNISDRYFCMEGPMVVETRAPSATYVLKPGETCIVPPKTAHYIHGQDDGSCRFMLVHGVGVYDFVRPAGSGSANSWNLTSGCSARF